MDELDQAGSGTDSEEEEAPPPPPEPTILEALATNDLDAVNAAIVRGEDLEQRDEERDHATPLILAVQKGLNELAEDLIVRSADVNARKGNKDSALHWACYKGNLRLVKALLAAGADIVCALHYRRWISTVKLFRAHISLFCFNFARKFASVNYFHPKKQTNMACTVGSGGSYDVAHGNMHCATSLALRDGRGNSSLTGRKIHLRIAGGGRRVQE
eukprot:1177699-Prorocentrum_minimum.AAC.3